MDLLASQCVLVRLAGMAPDATKRKKISRYLQYDINIMEEQMWNWRK